MNLCRRRGWLTFLLRSILSETIKAFHLKFSIHLQTSVPFPMFCCCCVFVLLSVTERYCQHYVYSFQMYLFETCIHSLSSSANAVFELYKFTSTLTKQAYKNR
jgi:hypothetical protein